MNITIEKLRTKKGFVKLERIEGPGVDKPFLYWCLKNGAELSFFIDDLFGVVLTKKGDLEFYKDSYSDSAFIDCTVPELIKGESIEDTMIKTLVSLYNNSCLAKDTVIDERYVNKTKKLFGFINI